MCVCDAQLVLLLGCHRRANGWCQAYHPTPAADRHTSTAAAPQNRITCIKENDYSELGIYHPSQSYRRMLNLFLRVKYWCICKVEHFLKNDYILDALWLCYRHKTL